MNGGDVIESVVMDDADAVQVLQEGRPDGIVMNHKKLILPGT